MNTQSENDEVHRSIDNPTKQATWEDASYATYVRQAIERGLADIEAGRTTPIEQIQSTCPISIP